MKSEENILYLKTRIFCIAEMCVVWGVNLRKAMSLFPTEANYFKLFPKWLSSLTSLFTWENWGSERVRNIIMPFPLLWEFRFFWFHKYYGLSCSLLVKMNFQSYFLNLFVIAAFQWQPGDTKWRRKALTTVVSLLDLTKASETCEN